MKKFKIYQLSSIIGIGGSGGYPFFECPDALLEVTCGPCV